MHPVLEADAPQRLHSPQPLLSGRDYLLPDDVKQLATPVLAHRVLLSADAELDGAAPERVVAEALDRVAYRPARP